MRNHYDIIIAGGGPAGSTTALLLARAGFSVCVLEKDVHPRFHIGESILPRNTLLLRQLGLEDAVKSLPHVPKFGAEFGMGNDFTTRKFQFTDGLLPGFPVFNIERSHFDKLLLDKAREAGAEVYEGLPVERILRLEDGAVRIATAKGDVEGRVLIDASGHGTIVGRHLNIRQSFADPELQKVAYFQHFDHVERPAGIESGHPCIIMCEEGWFWLIGLSETKTSVGFVTRPSFVKTLSIPPRKLLGWAVQRCPVVRHRMRNAVGDPSNVVLSDFSYRCQPYAGPGYFMVGDAACFLDPIFSTGVTLAMVSAQHTAETVGGLLKGSITSASARQSHIDFVTQSCEPFWRLIRGYYKHSFRELFMEGQGPLQMQKAVISILAGQVFPKPVWALRWRHRAFEACVKLQEHFSLVPKREPCRLVNQAPEPVRVFDDSPEIAVVREGTSRTSASVTA
jgi:flavin-dependent dehydrogenase